LRIGILAEQMVARGADGAHGKNFIGRLKEVA